MASMGLPRIATPLLIFAAGAALAPVPYYREYEPQFCRTVTWQGRAPLLVAELDRRDDSPPVIRYTQSRGEGLCV